MQVQLECPICEAVISIEKSKIVGAIVCSECNREFNSQSAQVVPNVPPVEVLIQQPPSLTEPLPAKVQDNFREMPDSGEYQLAPDSSRASNPSNGSVRLKSRTHLKGRQRPLLSAPVTLVLLALIAGGLLAALPFVLNVTGQNPNDVDDNTTASNTNLTTVPNTDETNITKTDSEDGVSETPGNPKKPVQSSRKNGKQKAAQPPTLTFFSMTQASRIWRDANPRIVELIIEKPTGSFSAVGTIVDSKGWMVTSFLAVKNASSIQVKQMKPSLDYEEELLLDTARGVIAVDPESDLAILEINRRFVVNFSRIEMAERDGIVAAKRLLYCTAPTETTPLGFNEVRVQNRRRISELGESEKVAFAQHQLESSAVEWIQLSDRELIPGSPLLDENGQFVAFSTSIGDAQQSYAVAASHVFDLMKNADGKTKSLASLGATPKPGVPNVAMDPTNAGGLPGAAPSDDLSVNLNRAGATCKLFKFQPNDIGQYRDLQEFLTQINEAEQFVLNNKNDVKAESIRKLIDNWKLALKPQTEIQANAFNLLAIEGMDTDPTAFSAYVQVHYSAMQSPRYEDKDTITFKILGTDRLLVCYFEDSLPVMRPDTKWYITFGSTEFDALGVEESDKTSPTRANLADILWINGELTDD